MIMFLQPKLRSVARDASWKSARSGELRPILVAFSRRAIERQFRTIVIIEASGAWSAGISRKAGLVLVFQSRYIYLSVNIQCSASLCSGDNILFFIFFRCICEFAGTRERREGILHEVKLRDRRFSLRPDDSIRH